MNKRIKGFTLVELLAVIVILSLLLLLAVTTVSSQFKNSKDELYDTQLNNIKLAAEMWGSDNKVKLNSISDCVSLTLGYLKDEGYVDIYINNLRFIFEGKEGLKHSKHKLKKCIEKNNNNIMRIKKEKENIKKIRTEM